MNPGRPYLNNGIPHSPALNEAAKPATIPHPPLTSSASDPLTAIHHKLAATIVHLGHQLIKVSSMESISASVPRSVCSAAYRRRRQKPGGSPAGRCNAMLKEHKTRLYILGRCVTMLLCWHDHDAD
ncbi:hypothetical protein BAE44_0018288 [Dichanthelium oligosanthes]|uniref:Uncharacterized protein n=1 Tax=Dichanthelium oligosanthes TaxID=888268 RepID=A0A1E5V6A1_9POAL|nr:hypothetical protein BAE44_0018288 [Dichanthelium oligosanthes]